MTDGPEKRSRPWFLRVLIESSAIVLSILLAFAIDAGWDERQDRLAEIEILEGLAVEFESYVQRFRRYSDFYGQMGDQIVWLLDSAESASSEVARMDEAMLSFVGAPTFDAVSGVHAELTASGRVSLLSDPLLRRRVVTWQARLNEATDNEVVIRDYVTSVMVPFLASRGIPIARISSVPHSSNWQLSVLPDSLAISSYRELMMDSEFRALAAWRYEWALGSARSYRRAELEADSVLMLVHSSLDR